MVCTSNYSAETEQEVGVSANSKDTGHTFCHLVASLLHMAGPFTTSKHMAVESEVLSCVVLGIAHMYTLSEPLSSLSCSKNLFARASAFISRLTEDGPTPAIRAKAFSETRLFNTPDKAEIFSSLEGARRISSSSSRTTADASTGPAWILITLRPLSVWFVSCSG